MWVHPGEYILDGPRPISELDSHCWRCVNPASRFRQRRMRTAKVVEHEVKADGVGVVLGFLAEAVR